VLSLERVKKYQRQIELLSRLVTVTKGRGTVMKRTHIKISTVSKGVTYPPTIEQRTLTIVYLSKLTKFGLIITIFEHNCVRLSSQN